MLQKKEKDGCEQIIRKLTHSELKSLFETVTRKRISADTYNEMVTAVLTFSESGLELLKRKKIRREYLFQYLADNKVPVKVAAEKHTIIRQILEYWGSKISSVEFLALENECNSSSSSYSLCGDDLTEGSVQVVPSSNDSSYSLYGEDLLQGTVKVASHDTWSKMCSTGTEQSRSNGSSTEKKDSLSQQLGETFASWHYKVLNSHNPTYEGQPQDSEYGAHHFWNDAKLTLKIVTPDPAEEIYEGSELVSERMLALVKEECLLFNPNISQDGVKAQNNPHGLVVISVCGTLHRGNDCLGIFEQMFGLIKDPRYDNNYKIKFTKLKLASSQVTKMPRLEDYEADSFLTVPAIQNNG